VATPGGVVITIVSDDAAVEAVVDDAVLAALGKGGVHLSMSTILPATSERLAREHAKHGVTYVAAPVFGRPEAAAAKKLWICTSGPEEAKARVRPILDAMGQGVYDFGTSVGAANVIKLGGNFMITALVETMAEGAALAEKNQIPRAAFLEFFGQTLFNSPVFNNYAKRLIAADYENVGFTGQLALKDMRLGLETALASNTPMPVLSLLRDRYLAAIANGEGQLDASAIALRAAEDAGLSWFPRDGK
jgi:3-hydroxyisobutyrate dehydrogenase-like beta-hydroxyacid dehydrogenase